MQKLNEIQRYQRIKAGSLPVFKHPDGQADGARLVKMRINAPDAVRLFTRRLDKFDPSTGEVVEGEEHFLAYVGPGYEQLEYWYRGDFALLVEGGEIWLDTLDSSVFDLEASDHENYARVWEREEIDPAIAEMMRVARYNQRVLEEQMARDRADYAARLEEMRQIVEKKNVPAPASDGNRGTASPVAPVPSGASGDDSGKPASAGTGTGGEPDADA